MSEISSAKRGLAGIFHKKSDKKDDENAKPEKKKLKKGHKRQRSIASTEDWPIQSSSESSDERTQTTDEKEKSKSRFRHRLSFRRSKSQRKKKHSAEKEKRDILPIEPALYSNTAVEQPNEFKLDVGEIIQQQLRPDVGVEEIVTAMGENIATPDLTTNVSTEIQEIQGSIADQTGPDVDTLMETIKREESFKNLEEKILPSTAISLEGLAILKELALNSEKLLLIDAISSLFQYEMSLCAYGFGLVKLNVLWSSLLSRAKRAKEASRQVLVYLISPLIKKYPHCFKVVKKRRRIKQAQKKIEAKTIEETAI